MLAWRVSAAAAARSSKRILLCDTTWSSDRGDDATELAETTRLRRQLKAWTSRTQPDTHNIYARTDFQPTIAFVKDYDQVIVAGRDELAVSAAKSLRALKPALVLAARLGKTKKSDIQKLLNVTDARVLIHE